MPSPQARFQKEVENLRLLVVGGSQRGSSTQSNDSQVVARLADKLDVRHQSG